MSHPFSATSLPATSNGTLAIKFNHIRLFNGVAPPQAKNTQSPPRRCVAANKQREKSVLGGGRPILHPPSAGLGNKAIGFTDKQRRKWQIQGSTFQIQIQITDRKQNEKT